MSLPDTIGGHDRLTLIYVSQRPSREWFGGCCNACRAAFAINDPAKLAALLAEALRERGTIVYLGDPGDSLRFPCVIILVDGPKLWIERFSDQEAVEDRMHGLYLDMPQARSALLRILELPEGVTTDEAVKALQCK